MTEAERRVNFIQAAAHLGRRLYLHYREQPAGQDFGLLVEEIEKADAWHQAALREARRAALEEAATYAAIALHNGKEVAAAIRSMKETP